MSYKLACELTDRFQAIASVTGSIVPSQVSSCMPSGTIPVMQIHGTADGTVFYNGSEIATPVEDLIAQWRDHNDCVNSSDTVFINDSNMADLTSAQYITYTDCAADRELWFYKIIGGGHTWPGSPILIGVTNQDFNASEEIWRFFSKYGEDISVSTNELAEVSTTTLHPNPFVNQLTINTEEGLIQNIRVINALGQVSFAISDINNNNYTIDASRLAKGSYFVEVQSEFGVEIKKVVKI